jgi:putative membrane protein
MSEEPEQPSQPGPAPDPSSPRPPEAAAAAEDAVVGPNLSSRRLHPAGAILSALDDVRNALFSVIVLLVLGSQSGNLGTVIVLLGVVGAAVAVSTGYVRWRAETYEIADASIRHRHGVISPDETVVPLARVHSIDIAQGPIQRLFGVNELHVQTAGGGEKGEIVLRAVSPAETARLRAAAGLPEATATDLPEWRLSPRGLILVGLTAPQLGMLLPLVGGAFAVGNDLLGQQGTRDTLTERLPTETGGILLLIAAAIAAAWLLSFLGSLIAFAGFSVTRDGDHLRIHRGFLQRRATSVPLRRVHAVSVAEGPFRRPFGLCSVRLETAGYGSEPSAARTLFPLLPIASLDAELATFVPALAGTSAPAKFTRPPHRAIRRYILSGTLPVLLLTIAATLAWPVAWPAMPALTALAALDGFARYRSAGSHLDSTRLLLRHGSITHRTLIARPTRLQDHSFAQTTFQREAELADISITVASGTTSKVAHLEATDATSLFNRLRPAA